MQNYQNHIRYYAPHHFVFYPLIIVGFIVCVSKAVGASSDFWLWTILAAVFMLLGWLSFMLRQHYALTLQNRVVVLEMRFRYFVLTGKQLSDRLSFGQVAALRFASDPELSDMVDRALKDNLGANEIKTTIKQWLPDNSRV
ncbi:DUF6526 family protein [Pedobacter sp. MC2016-24]|uniref:DUF6526 family protein n=1 Tax=Pedobacter sp. MC2016-24 TaxID=2780090 RepID=UPI00188077EF|nr:DUF6526 family protein [Pedobacter sp. MC2016-24]MBE9600815.1 hypothetical protein [Pedobacter sp. MC2016-24]